MESYYRKPLNDTLSDKLILDMLNKACESHIIPKILTVPRCIPVIVIMCTIQHQTFSCGGGHYHHVQTYCKLY